MRSRSSRSFTVETKSGRRQRPIIPHRAAAPEIPRPAVSWPPLPESSALVAEPRRILPNLIALEPEQVELAPVQVAEDGLPRRRRGRPPKVKQVAAEMVEEMITKPAVEIAVAALAPVHRASVRSAKLPAVLPPGERWKRRLGRWSR